MRNRLGRRQRRVTRRRKGVAHASRCGTNHHDLVSVLACGDLAREHIVERVDGERRTPVAAFVKLRQHHCRFVRLDAQLADLHRLARVELHIAGSQIQAFQRRQQGHRRNRIAVIVDKQGLAPHRAVRVLKLVQMPDRAGRVADDFNRLLATDSGHGKSVLLADRTLEGIGGQRFVGIALRVAQRENRGDQNVSGVFHAGSQHSVCVKCQLGLRNHLCQCRIAGGLITGSITRRPQKAFHLADELQSAVHLGLNKEYGMDDCFGLGSCKLIDQLCMDITRPGPTADIGNALVINGNDRHAVRWLARGAGAGKVVEAPLHRSDQVGRGIQQQDRHHNGHTGKPVCTPELDPFG